MTLTQTNMTPLSLFYLLLQIQRHVNRLQSIRQEPDFHSRVVVKTFCSSPVQETVKTRATETGTAFGRRGSFSLYGDAEMGKRNSWHLCVTTKTRAAKACCVRVGSGFGNSHNQWPGWPAVTSFPCLILPSEEYVLSVHWSWKNCTACPLTDHQVHPTCVGVFLVLHVPRSDFMLSSVIRLPWGFLLRSSFCITHSLDSNTTVSGPPPKHLWLRPALLAKQ